MSYSSIHQPTKAYLTKTLIFIPAKLTTSFSLSSVNPEPNTCQSAFFILRLKVTCLNRYSLATAWVGIFAERATGKTLPTLFREIILNPLGIPRTETGLWLPSECHSRRSTIYQKNRTSPELAERFTPISPELYFPPGEDSVEEGKAAMGDGGIVTTCRSYVKILQAILNEDPRILSAEHWKMATRDDLKERGMGVPYPEWDAQANTGFRYGS